MLSQYQLVIIAAIIIITAFIIFLIVKRQKKKVQVSEDSQEKIEEIEPKASPTTQEEIIPEEPKHEIIEDIYDELQGSEEGDFGVEEVEEASSDETTTQPIHKRDVPPHGKIKKQDFAEFSGLRIMIAEDNLINQKVINGLLADSGIELVIANDGQEALDILEKDDDFLMILMDAHMPRVDGFEATRAIRANPKYDHILVVALSGDTAADDIAKMSAAGMAEHLEKPLRMDALYDVLYAYSHNYEAKEESEFVEVVMTQELNGDKGLEICGGDEAFYHEILDEFSNNYEDSTHELGDLLKNGEIDKADKILLDIIGVTANIGADPLHDIAVEIKSKLSDQTGKSYLNLVDAYKTHLDNLLKDIKEYKEMA